LVAHFYPKKIYFLPQIMIKDTEYFFSDKNKLRKKAKILRT